MKILGNVKNITVGALRVTQEASLLVVLSVVLENL